MSKVLCEREDLVAIADAIRGKTGETAEMGLAAMPGKIAGISGGNNNYTTCVLTIDAMVYGTSVTFYYVMIDDNNNIQAMIDEISYTHKTKTVNCLSGTTFTVKFMPVTYPSTNYNNLTNVFEDFIEYQTTFLIPEGVTEASYSINDND